MTVLRFWGLLTMGFGVVWYSDYVVLWTFRTLCCGASDPGGILMLGFVASCEMLSGQILTDFGFVGPLFLGTCGGLI